MQDGINYLKPFIGSFFKAEAHRISRFVAAKYGKTIKAPEDDIISKLKLDWVKITNGFDHVLEPVVSTSTSAALAELGINDADIFDAVQKDAIEWVSNRAAELIGRKYNKAGELVPNPDAKWTITDSTREGLRDLIGEAYKDGWDVTRLGQEIENSYMFSESRAEMIARTELARADMQTTLTAWKESGVVTGKVWVLGSEHDDGNPDECDDNVEDGVIDLDDLFSSGDDAPPAHPNCVCVLVTQMLVDSGEIEVTEE
jgi:hypothetical protein